MTEHGELHPGIYEELLTANLNNQLHRLGTDLSQVEILAAAEAPDRLALHLADIVERTVSQFTEESRVTRGVALVREVGEVLLARANESNATELAQDLVSEGRVLRAVYRRRPDGQAEHVQQPLTPLLDTALLTNPRSEPAMSKQIQSEIPSAHGIDLIMAFIRFSGLRPLLDDLRRHCQSGRRLRILTTTFTGTTEGAALVALAELGADIRVSYDTDTTRLHAKAWMFHRNHGVSTAYVGSSNLTHAAQVDGLEWNVRISSRRNRDVLTKMAAVFDSYWESGDFVPFDSHEFAEAMTQARGYSGSSGQGELPLFELTPRPFQRRLLERIQVARQLGHHRNLLVAATGTGKTVMAALDYAHLRRVHSRSRLLFVAHREELLTQALSTFRHALREAAFGELWVGGRRPKQFEHVFASIQSLTATGVDTIDPAHFDTVIIDEFHHAAADSYNRLLTRLKPVELLGMTATPERADGMPILHWFDDRIAAELRLWDAIDQQRLVPFAYYGIHDGADLSAVPWRRGAGYDTTALTNLYTADDAWARVVIHQTRTHVGNTSTMRALGFCVSKAHAHFMARHFNAAGIKATAVTADSSSQERAHALADLRAGTLQAVFSVDLFNEGVDVPAVDTVLMLRPTESPTIFLQQLGRGLRKSADTDKSVCTVLDFVGLQRNEFRFDRLFTALLGGTRNSVAKQIQAGFPYLPSGCYMELDPTAQEIVLASIRNALPTTWPERVAELRRYAAALDPGTAVTLAGFLADSGLELTDIYRNETTSRPTGKCSWSDLKHQAGLHLPTSDEVETKLRQALGRMTHVDDMERLKSYAEFGSHSTLDAASLSPRSQALLRMLVVTLAGEVLRGDRKNLSLQEATDLVWRYPAVLGELVELMGIRSGQVDHLHTPLARNPDVPLQVHARYKRSEILAAMHQWTPSPQVAPRTPPARTPEWREGVYWCPDRETDLLAITFDKTAGHFSPTTRYRDYAAGPYVIHWESQSRTSTTTAAGHRYLNHASLGTQVFIFARESNPDSFHFLGPARYVCHSGERPIAIDWHLEHPLPGDLLAAFSAVA